MALPLDALSLAKVTFIDPDGTRHCVDATPGQSLLKIARQSGISVEGACEGYLSCSTCHVIVDPHYHRRLPAADEDETEMLDLAYGRTSTSRLCCRLKMSDELDGLVVSVPAKFPA